MNEKQRGQKADVEIMNEIATKIDQINRMIQEVREYKAAHPETVNGYYLNNYGSLLNAYREGDLGFDECVTLLAKVDQSKRSTDDAICDDIDLIVPLVKDLTAYQALVYVALYRHDIPDPESAIKLVAKHARLIEDHERRRFEPSATARAIIEQEANLSGDTARLDWLEAFIQTGVIEAGFEVDGGVHLTLNKLGEPEPTAYREKNSLREAMDEAMKEG